MKQFVFMIMGQGYKPKEHCCRFEPGRFISHVHTVEDFEEAKRAVRQWQKEGVGVVECCGAFSQEMVKELRCETGNTLPISAGVHFAAQDPLFDRYFGVGDYAQDENKAAGDYMMMMMDEGYDPQKDKALFQTVHGITRIETVRNFEEAKQRFSELMDDGVGLVECCGSFTPDAVQKLIEFTGGKLPIGYMHTEPSLLPEIEAFFYGG